ncbi:hypothetical protein [Sphingomonas colocasiae]|uniref:Uncharacterized protein n=1 Tax=Sphingomonas colocasiae TaxID=1848973 RepID=A0ABS7PPW8_9SPHN|nr:hypothetical protein [Sphingomonas colocasiae]MBY8823370.1 hypothetical protein [Sphingomonas colocasiae]
MGFSDIGLRHIVDVDGQLLGIDADVIDTASLLARADRPADSQLWLVRAGERFAVRPKQLIRLSEDDVLFFETSATNASPATELLAA